MAVLIQAERIWNGPGRVERGWGVRVEDGHVLEAGPLKRLLKGRPPGEPVVDCGRTVLMPGLVNLHVHLELGWLRDRVSPRGGFAHWVRELRRLQVEASAELGEEGLRRETVRAIQLGANELLHHGTTTFLDVSNTGLPAECLPPDGPRGFLALECLGLDRSRVASTLERARGYVARGVPGRHRVLAVPHALYSCSGELLRGLADPALHGGRPCMHLLESEEEFELFQSGWGPLREMVDSIHADHDLLPGESALTRLELFFGPPPGFIAVHGYAMAQSDVQRLAQTGAALALCPSSRAFFLHPTAPLGEILRHRMTVGLGTDSLASSPALSLWREMARLAEDHPDLEPGRILSWATEGGARALGIPAGRLAPGHWADWIAVEAADVPDEHLEDYLVRDEPEVRMVAVDGELLLDGR